jgi:hypothetical protein
MGKDTGVLDLLNNPELSAEALASNRKGKVLPLQEERLMTAFGQAVPPNLPQDAPWWLLIAVLGAALIIWIALTGDFLWNGSSSLIVGGTVGLLLPLTMRYLLHIIHVQAALEESRFARRRLEGGHYDIDSWDKPVELYAEEPRRWRRWLLGQRVTYWLVTPMHRFRIPQPLWDHLRRDGDGMTIYYLSKPLPALLSIHLIPRPDPPTNAELAAVIGLTDEGELIYEEQTPQRSSQR